MNAYDRRSLTSVRQALARSYALDLSAQARDLKKKLQRRSLMPICLPDGRVFVPLKMRRPRITRDSAYGYIDLAFIKSVQENEESANLLLNTGEVIPLCTSAAAALNAINLGKLMAKRSTSTVENERENILSALSLLVDKLYRIESLLTRDRGTGPSSSLRPSLRFGTLDQSPCPLLGKDIEPISGPDRAGDIRDRGIPYRAHPSGAQASRFTVPREEA